MTKPLPSVHRPIILVRGFAAKDEDVREVVSDPFMGFNRGSTLVREDKTAPVRQEVFESLVVRLMEDYGYRASFDRIDPDTDEPYPKRPIVIQRYYDVVSSDFGDGKRRPIEAYAAHLAGLVLETSEQHRSANSRSDGRVYLVGHSMGGLICRTMLQNDRIAASLPGGLDDLEKARRLIDKVVTYATPHGGVHFKFIGNVPDLPKLTFADNFNTDHMRDFLGLPDHADPSDLCGSFPIERFLCIVGTNHEDYGKMRGLSSDLTGERSDGLVRTAEATVRDTGRGSSGPVRFGPQVFVHRTHGGRFGIVPSEGAYRALSSFLFGSARVEARLLYEPGARQREEAEVQVEVEARGRDLPEPLHQRTKSTDAAIMMPGEDTAAFLRGEASLTLFTLFLGGGLMNAGAFDVDLDITLPPYVDEGGLLIDGPAKQVSTSLSLAIARIKGPAGGWQLAGLTGASLKPGASKDLSDGGQLVHALLPERSDDGAFLTIALEITPWQ